MSMEEDNDIDEDEGDDVQDAKDLLLLERWQRQRDGVVVDDDDGDDEDDRELDNIDSDDEESGDDITPAVLPYVEVMSPPCNTILLLLPCNYVSLFTTTSHLFMLTILIFVIAGTRQNTGRRRKEEVATKELPLTLRRSR
jgi:hypothetical protein